MAEESNLLTHLSILLRPDPARLVIRTFVPAETPPDYDSATRSRAQGIADHVMELDAASLASELRRVFESLDDRYRDIEHILMRRYNDVRGRLIDDRAANEAQALLIGACFSEEYAFEAAALFNPSIVPHPDQSGAPEGSVRFILSLRAVGEGHVSSITFRTGMCGRDGAVSVDPPSHLAAAPRIETPDENTVRLFCDASHDLSEIVIFPVSSNQRNGLEDLRLVRFTDDDGSIEYFGTYTAFSGQAIRQELLRTTDFATFELNALTGAATANKGMALFPRKIDGLYAMLGRQDHESIWLLQSKELTEWQGGTKIVAPRWPWEFVQIGNGGSPIEIDEGWLVLTHGVGAVRNYCIGACLLDKRDPSKLLARSTWPLVRPTPEARYGYVPNIAYTCGAMAHGRTLVLPYAIADSFSTFATVSIDRLLQHME